MKSLSTISILVLILSSSILMASTQEAIESAKSNGTYCHYCNRHNVLFEPENRTFTPCTCESDREKCFDICPSCKLAGRFPGDCWQLHPYMIPFSGRLYEKNIRNNLLARYQTKNNNHLWCDDHNRSNSLPSITMKYDLPIKNGIVIPEHELEFTASRAGGPGGQHVNKASTRITVRWNVKNSSALTEEQKNLVQEKLQSQLTTDGDLIIHNSASRSQEQNKRMALARLAQLVRNALHVPKKRKATRIPKQAKELRHKEKMQRSFIKKMRSKNYDE